MDTMDLLRQKQIPHGEWISPFYQQAIFVVFFNHEAQLKMQICMSAFEIRRCFEIASKPDYTSG